MHKPIRRDSLLERAARAYDFGAGFRAPVKDAGDPVQDDAVSAPMPAPDVEPAPVAEEPAWQAAAPDLLDQPGLALARSPSAGVAEGDEAADGDQGVDGMADSAGGAAAASGSADVIAASGAAASGASSGGGSFK